jgi:(5-formylfuran-3-yl)methyl phosphate synthase
MMRLLVSVRSVAEARLAVAGGADFVDLKEPGRGALGGLPVETIRAVVAALEADGHALPVSATIGDVPMDEATTIAERVQAVGACGVDYVKVGIEAAPAARDVLAMLARCGRPVVPVFIADRGLDGALVERALALGFPAVMADTADKRGGSLFDRVPEADLQDFVQCARARGAMVGLAGALRQADLPRLLALKPDFAGFRSAVCNGSRAGELDTERLRALRAAAA